MKDVNGVPDLVIDRIYAYEDFGKQIVLSGNNSDLTLRLTNYKHLRAFHYSNAVISKSGQAGYINKELDSESSLANHGVRKYDNTIGRFITPDALWKKYYACWSEAEIPITNRESHYHYSGKKYLA